MMKAGYFLHMIFSGDGCPQSEAERKAALEQVGKYPKSYTSTCPEVARDEDIKTMGAG